MLPNDGLTKRWTLSIQYLWISVTPRYNKWRSREYSWSITWLLVIITRDAGFCRYSFCFNGRIASFNSPRCNRRQAISSDTRHSPWRVERLRSPWSPLNHRITHQLSPNTSMEFSAKQVASKINCYFELSLIASFSAFVSCSAFEWVSVSSSLALCVRDERTTNCWMK